MAAEQGLIVDSVIANLPASYDGDLMLCRAHGVAYQRDMADLVTYDDDYFNKCLGYEGQEIAQRINAGRIALVNRHVGPDCNVLDVGIGSGEFIKLRSNTWGCDVNPKAIEWLNSEGRFDDRFEQFGAFTFWDVLEHVPEPHGYLARMPAGAWLFCSLPIFADLSRIRSSKHYRPGEHLYYWTQTGFVGWMRRHGFQFRDCLDFETQAGRESILSFAFQRG